MGLAASEGTYTLHRTGHFIKKQRGVAKIKIPYSYADDTIMEKRQP